MLIRFTAVSRPDQVGVSVQQWPNNDAGRSHTTRNYWYVPLVNPDDPDPELIPAWVGNRYPALGTATPDAWLERVQQQLDGKEVTLRSGFRRGQVAAERPPAFWALTEAERQHGILSHPNAVLFSVE